MMFLKSFMKRMNFYTYLFISIICFVTLICFINITLSTSNEISKKSEQYSNREIILLVEEDIDNIKNKVKNIKEITKIYNNINSIVMFENNFLTVNTYVYEKDINIVKGRKINEDEKGVILLPNSYIDYLDKSINLDIDGKELEYKVVGLYEDDIDKTDYIYISYYDNLELDSLNNGYILLIDKYNNVNRVIKELSQINYSSVLNNGNISQNIETLNTLKIISYALTIIIGVFIYIFVYSIIKDMLNEDKYDIAIFKSLGYRDINIVKINLLKVGSIMIVAFLISLPISYFISFLLNKINISFITFEISYYKISLIIVFVIESSILLLSNIFSFRKIKNTRPIIIFKDEQY